MVTDSRHQVLGLCVISARELCMMRFPVTMTYPADSRTFALGLLCCGISSEPDSLCLTAAAGFQPSMEANYGDIGKRRKSKGLPAKIYDPQEQQPPTVARTTHTGTPATSHPSVPNAAPPEHSEHPESVSVPPAVAADAALEATTGEAAHKRRRSTAGGGARTKGGLLSQQSYLELYPC